MSIEINGAGVITGVDSLSTPAVTNTAGSASAPSITFTGDTNTGVYSPGADQVAISTGGSGRLFIDSAGRVDAYGPNLRLHSYGVGASFALRRSEGTQAAPTAVSSASSIAGINLQGYDGSSFQRVAAISAYSDGAISSTASPGYLIIETTPSGSTTPQERLRITSAGRIGIGTSNPQSPLHSYAGTNTRNNIYVQGTEYGIRLGNKATVGASIDGVDATNGVTSYQPLFLNGSTVILGTDDSERLRITSAGLVGVGTSSPSWPLDVNGVVRSTGTSAMLALSDRSTGTGDRYGVYSNNNTFRIYDFTAAADRAVVDSSGRFLVGTSSSPTQPEGQYALLVVQGYQGSSTGEGIAAIQRGVGAASLSSGNDIGRLIFNDSAGNTFAGIYCNVDATPGAGDYPGRLVFSTTADGASSPTERMRIDNAGVVSISSGRLYIQKSDASNPLCYAYNTNNTSTDVAYRSELGAGSNGTSAYHFYAVTGGSAKFAIYGNGTYGTISDQRLKTHIETARNGYLDDLNRLNIVKYGWKTDGLDQATELGVIAQEVEKVFPGLIQETPPNEDGEVYKGVKTSVFTFMLIKALQEASAKIETLEAKVAALESA